MSRLQFKEGHTIHSWSGYGDGHIPLDILLSEIKISNNYLRSRNKILDAEVLLIDEIGMLSAKVIEHVERICRYIRNNDQIFGGLQVIAAGSFLQLPPVPSLHDQGNYAFESKMFSRIFPHKINLQAVHRQQQFDFVQSINELCDGTPSKRTHDLMISLKRPIANAVNPVYIFGTNFEVDFFNSMTLAQLPGVEHVFDAKDTGDKHTLRKCTVPKHLVLKTGCKVIVTRNLENGLVNGLSAEVILIEQDKVQIKINVDKHMSHKLQGQTF